MTEVATRVQPPRTRGLPWRRVRVVEVIEETARARSLVLHVPGWPGHLAGQHADIRVTAEDGYQAQRSYSIASPPERAEVVLTVDRIEAGEVSPYLTGVARAGDEFELRGPIGGYFTWNATTTESLQLIAGGSGIVPLMAMLRHRALSKTKGPARLLYSSRNSDSIIYRDELERLASDSRLRVTLTVTREADAAWSGQRGRIDADMLRSFAFPPAEQPRVYVCGPTPFVEAVANASVALGHAPARIKTERFGPT